MSLPEPRRAEEQKRSSSAGQGSLPIVQLPQSIPSISKTIRGDTMSYVINGECSISVDQFGKHIQFSQFPGLRFSSMEAAFHYFEAHAKLQKQRTIQANARPVDCATQQMWQFDPSLKPANVRPVVRLPTPYLRQGGPCFESAAESISQEPLRALDAEYPLSRLSPPETPPLTLFAESTPHAQNIQTHTPVELSAEGLQSWRPVELPVDEAQSLINQSQAMNGFGLQSFLPSLEVSNPANTSIENYSAPHYDQNILISSPCFIDDGILAQPQSSYGVLPQTLVKKDLRVLGVPLTADIDE